MTPLAQSLTDPRAPAAAALPSPLADLLTDLSPADANTLRRGLLAVLQARPLNAPLDELTLDLMLTDCDRRLAAQLDTILHHPAVQALEATWRSLWTLTERVSFADGITLELLQYTRDDMRDDFAEAPELTASGLYFHVYRHGIGLFGAAPFSFICADLEFGPGAEDISLLRQCTAVAAMAHAPFIANASPDFFGCPDFTGLPRLRDIAGALANPRFRAWQAFRATEDARYLGLCLPRTILRAAYDPATDPSCRLPYRESITSTKDLLWGRASFAFALLAADSFANYRWCVHILGSRAAAGNHQLRWDYPTLSGLWHRNPLECTLSARLEQSLADEGFIALVHERTTGCTRLISAPSVQRARMVAQTTEADRAAAAGERLGAQLPYIFLISRLAHYLKCVQRERIGSWLDRSELERELGLWLRQYVSAMEDVQLEVRARRPLRSASVTVEAIDGQTGWYRCRLQIQPHISHNSAAFTLSMLGKLDRPGSPESSQA